MLKADIKIIKADLSEHDFIYLVPLSDFHWDEPQSDHKGIKGYVDWIKSHKNAYTLLNGDLVTAPTAKSAANIFEMAKEVLVSCCWDGSMTRCVCRAQATRLAVAVGERASGWIRRPARP